MGILGIRRLDVHVDKKSASRESVDPAHFQITAPHIVCY
jgi:hypothetical protein